MQKTTRPDATTYARRGNVDRRCGTCTQTARQLGGGDIASTATTSVAAASAAATAITTAVVAGNTASTAIAVAGDTAGIAIATAAAASNMERSDRLAWLCRSECLVAPKRLRKDTPG